MRYTMSWTVVHFIEEESVEAVPTSWVHNEACYWPPFFGSKLAHSINKCEEPVLNIWTLHKIKKLGNGRIYGDLFILPNNIFSLFVTNSSMYNYKMFG